MNQEEEVDKAEEGEELSFQELYAKVLFAGEIIITIPKEEVQRIMTGLKNLKAKQAAKLKEQGLPADPSVFTFTEQVPLKEEYKKHFTDLSIQLGRKGLVKIAKIRIPDNEM